MGSFGMPVAPKRVCGKRPLDDEGRPEGDRMGDKGRAGDVLKAGWRYSRDQIWLRTTTGGEIEDGGKEGGSPKAH